MVLKSGQRPKRTLQVAALAVEDHPPRFTVARAFADSLRKGDVVTFIPHRDDGSPLWSKTWRVVRVEGVRFAGGNDTRKVYATGVT